MDLEKGTWKAASYLLRVVLNLAGGPGFGCTPGDCGTGGCLTLPCHSLWERARKKGRRKDRGEMSSGTGDSLSVALRDESLISHRSISRSSGSCTHLMIGHDVSLNTRANEWLPTQTLPAHPCRRSIAQSFFQPAITVVQNQTTNNQQCLYAS